MASYPSVARVQRARATPPEDRDERDWEVIKWAEDLMEKEREKRRKTHRPLILAIREKRAEDAGKLYDPLNTAQWREWRDKGLV